MYVRRGDRWLLIAGHTSDIPAARAWLVAGANRGVRNCNHGRHPSMDVVSSCERLFIGFHHQQAFRAQRVTQSLRLTGPSFSSSQPFTMGTRNSWGGLCPPTKIDNFFGSRSSL